jgi:hypothetical protein
MKSLLVEHRPIEGKNGTKYLDTAAIASLCSTMLSWMIVKAETWVESFMAFHLG